MVLIAASLNAGVIVTVTVQCRTVSLFLHPDLGPRQYLFGDNSAVREFRVNQNYILNLRRQLSGKGVYRQSKLHTKSPSF